VFDAQAKNLGQIISFELFPDACFGLSYAIAHFSDRNQIAIPIFSREEGKS
jgi:hypothetical protein